MQPSRGTLCALVVCAALCIASLYQLSDGFSSLSRLSRAPGAPANATDCPSAEALRLCAEAQARADALGDRERALLRRLDALETQLEESQEASARDALLKHEALDGLRVIESRQTQLFEQIKGLRRTRTEQAAERAAAARARSEQRTSLLGRVAAAEALLVGELHAVRESARSVSAQAVEAGERRRAVSGERDQSEALAEQARLLGARVQALGAQVSELLTCRGAPPRADYNYTLVMERLMPAWEEERARTEALLRGVVCPLDPLHELCFSEQQLRVRRLVDYAQRSAGAVVVHAQTAPTFRASLATPLLSSVIALAESLQIRVDGAAAPEVALSRDSSLGNCWPMKGSAGNLTVRLQYPVRVTSVSLDHISLNEAVDITTAPKAFRVFAVGAAGEGERLLAAGTYLVQEDPQGVVQNFPAQEGGAEETQHVRLVIDSNHGNALYTCLYRFRVHGDLEPQLDPH